MDSAEDAWRFRSRPAEPDRSPGAPQKVEHKVQRQTLSLDGQWDFHFCGDVPVALDRVGEWRAAAVPAPWQAQFGDLRERNGRAWYRRTFDVPGDWLNSAVVIRFGAVNYHARVLVNGMPALEHEGGWLPFEADIAALLRPGRNEIAVAVTAPTDDPAVYPEFPFSETPIGKQSWYGPLGGIWQSVTLECRSPDHIRTLRLVPQARNGSVAVAIAFARPLSHAGTLDLRIEDPAGHIVASRSLPVDAGQADIDTALSVLGPLLWSPDTPHLYRLAALLRSEGETLDTLQDCFGFRTVETRDGRIHLNGKPIYLRSALDQDYYPDGICTAPSEQFLEDQFRKAKELGLNCLRCHIKVPDPRYYAVADRIGLLIWTELPNSGRLAGKAFERAEATLRGIIERDGNHPSIFCWTIINENWGTDLVHNAEHRAWLQRTYHWLKGVDPTRLVVDNSPLGPSFHVESDLDDIHFYAAIPDHRRNWDGFVEGLATRPDWTYSPHGDARRTGQEPLMCSEFGNWGLPDPEQLKGPDGAEPWWFETGHDWGESVMYAHGVQNRFRACGLERVFGSLKAFAEAAQWQQFRALKYQIEAMRRQPALAGYVITEFTDCHWESNGLLDMRRNPRVFHDVFGTVNADTVVVPRWERTAYWAEEPVRIELAAAHGGADTLRGVDLRWRLDTASARGSQPMTVPHGVVTAEPALFQAPAVSEPGIHRVAFELAARDRIVASNHLDLAIHPRRDEPAAGRPALWAGNDDLRGRFEALGYRVAPSMDKADILVAQALDADLCGAVRNGARLVLLAERDFELQPVFPHWQAVRVVRREGTMWQGDWASSFSWLRREGPFARLPGGPLIDHAFDRVIPRHVIANCNTWDFQTRVHAGMVVGWVHKPVALIVERNCGHGRMVTSTFRLLDDAPGADPTATLLFDGLIELALK
jgi:hypothetical protein